MSKGKRPWCKGISVLCSYRSSGASSPWPPSSNETPNSVSQACAREPVDSIKSSLRRKEFLHHDVINVARICIDSITKWFYRHWDKSDLSHFTNFHYVPEIWAYDPGKPSIQFDSTKMKIICIFFRLYFKICSSFSHYNTKCVSHQLLCDSTESVWALTHAIRL